MLFIVGNHEVQVNRNTEVKRALREHRAELYLSQAKDAALREYLLTTR